MVEVNSAVHRHSADLGPGGPRNLKQIANCVYNLEKIVILKKQIT